MLDVLTKLMDLCSCWDLRRQKCTGQKQKVLCGFGGLKVSFDASSQWKRLTRCSKDDYYKIEF